MKTVLLLVAALVGAPDNMHCNVKSFDNRTIISVACESANTGKWFVALIDRATGTVRRVTGRKA